MTARRQKARERLAAELENLYEYAAWQIGTNREGGPGPEEDLHQIVLTLNRLARRARRQATWGRVYDVRLRRLFRPSPDPLCCDVLAVRPSPDEALLLAAWGVAQTFAEACFGPPSRADLVRVLERAHELVDARPGDYAT